MAKETGTIKLNVDSLLKSLGKTLYKEPSVALRELIQNGHDAVSFYRRTLDFEQEREFKGKIQIDYKASQSILSVLDNGIGMSKKDLEEEFSKVGGTLKSDEEVLKEIIASRGGLGRRIIGQYGIGFLAAFLVAERVEVFSKKEGEQGYRWECSGGEIYTIEEYDVDFPRGTEVRLHLMKSALPKEFANLEEIKKLAKRYGYLLQVPIYVGNAHVNPYAAYWSSSEAFNAVNEVNMPEFLRERFPVEFLDVFKRNCTAETTRHGNTSYRACFFIGESSGIERYIFRGSPFDAIQNGIDIFVKGMFVCRVNDFLPPWASFVNGLVDFDNLNVSLSREDIVENDLLKLYKTMLEKDVADRIRALKSTQKLSKIVALHRESLVQGVALFGERKQEEKVRDLFDTLIEILPFETTDGPKTIEEYQTEIRVASEKHKHCEINAIYCMSSKTTGVSESLLAEELGWPVILTLPIEEKILSDFVEARKKDVKLKVMQPDDFFTQASETNNDNEAAQLERDIEHLFNFHLSRALPNPDRFECRVRRFRESVPALMLLETGEDLAGNRFFQNLENSMSKGEIPTDLQKTLEKMASMFRSEKNKRLLYVNSANQNIKSLVQIYKSYPYDDSLSLACSTIYNSALLQSAQYSLSPADGQIIVENFNQTLAQVLKLTLEIREKEVLNAQKSASNPLIDKEETEPFVFCIHPFNDDSSVAAIEQTKNLLLDKFKIVGKSANEEVRDFKIPENVKEMIRKCRFAIADISESNPNVMIEIGMLAAYEKPVVKIRNKKIKGNLPIDLAGDFYCEYTALNDENKWYLTREFDKDLSKHIQRAIDLTN